MNEDEMAGRPALVRPLDFNAIRRQYPAPNPAPVANRRSEGVLKFGPDASQHFSFSSEDLIDYGEIGAGAFGTVSRMAHRGSGRYMAVKRIRSLLDQNGEETRALRELEYIMQSADCPFIVQFFGAIFKEGDCWICMELMDTSMERLYKDAFTLERKGHPAYSDVSDPNKLKLPMPENIIGRMAFCTISALKYLKDGLKIIHRDVKPSNVLVHRSGTIKLCDFGIAGELKDSIAKTQDAGCRPYMAPERVDPARSKKGYDVRSDVWSLGITLIEMEVLDRRIFPSHDVDTILSKWTDLPKRNEF